MTFPKTNGRREGIDVLGIDPEWERPNRLAGRSFSETQHLVEELPV